MNNQQIIKQNTNYEDDRNCDLCEGCDKRFNQNEEVLWDEHISPMWEYHQDIGNDDGDLCADCILKLDYCVDKCLECEELYDRNRERDELTSKEMEVWGKCVDDGLDNGDLCVKCLLKQNS